jgi:hypothetical protein
VRKQHDKNHVAYNDARGSIIGELRFFAKNRAH